MNKLLISLMLAIGISACGQSKSELTETILQCSGAGYGYTETVWDNNAYPASTDVNLIKYVDPIINIHPNGVADVQGWGAGTYKVTTDGISYLLKKKDGASVIEFTVNRINGEYSLSANLRNVVEYKKGIVAHNINRISAGGNCVVGKPKL